MRQALVLVHWPGAGAERIEQLVTRRIEEKIAENVRVDKIESNTRTGVTSVIITLVEGLSDTGKEFDDIKLKLDTIRDLPDGAGPITFIKDFGDTAALMLTVASPKIDDAQIALTADMLAARIQRSGAGRRPATASRWRSRCRPRSTPIRPAARRCVPPGGAGRRRDSRRASDRRPGFFAVDAATDLDDAAIDRYLQQFLRERVADVGVPSRCRPARHHSRPRHDERQARRRRRQQVQLSRARRLHGAHRAHAARAAGGVEGHALGRARGACLPRILAGAACLVRRQRRTTARSARRAQHLECRRHDRDRLAAVERRSLGRVQVGEGARRRAGADASGSAGLSARSCRCVARVRQPGDLPEFLHRPHAAGGLGEVARHHAGHSDAHGLQIADFGKSVDATLARSASCFPPI